MKRFAMVPLDLVNRDLAGRAWRVLIALMAHADQGGQCWPTDRTLADLTGIHEDNVRKVIRDLRKLGLISRGDYGRGRGILLEAEARGGSAATPPGIESDPQGIKSDPQAATRSGHRRGSKAIPGGSNLIPFGAGQGIESDPQGIGNDPQAGGDRDRSPGDQKRSAQGIKSDPPIRTDQEQTREQTRGGVAPAREHTHAKGPPTSLPDGPIPQPSGEGSDGAARPAGRSHWQTSAPHIALREWVARVAPNLEVHATRWVDSDGHDPHLVREAIRKAVEKTEPVQDPQYIGKILQRLFRQGWKPEPQAPPDQDGGPQLSREQREATRHIEEFKRRQGQEVG